MSIVKVIEVIAEGNSYEDAVQNAVKEASHSIKDLKQIDIEHVYGIIENNKVVRYRVNAHISFVIHHNA